MVLAAPSDVKTVRVTVTGGDIVGDLHVDMTFAAGKWSGSVPNVPAGASVYSVTAYAYNITTVPADPEDPAYLIFKGSTYGVSVLVGQVSSITVRLLPFPNNVGEIGINTPPHIMTVTHPAWIESGATATLTATALDPDAGNLLTYTWSDGGSGGTFSGTTLGAVVNQTPGDVISVGYVPAAGFVGTATIHLDVTDGNATASTSFQLAVGSGVRPTLVFVAIPEIKIVSVGTQELMQGGTTPINYQLNYPANPGPDALALPGLSVNTSWIASCGGTFDVASGSETVTVGVPVNRQVVYTAPPPGAASSGQCDLSLTISDADGASVWSKVVVWVKPAADFRGSWSGTVMDPRNPPSQVTLQFDQAGGVLTGTFSDGFESGTVTGTVDGATATYTVNITVPGFCTGTLTGTATVSATSMDVAWAGNSGCSPGPISSTGTLTPLTKLVFVTSQPSQRTGNLGGLAGGDTFCQDRAIASGSVVPAGGTYKAFLSDSVTDARDRIVDARYVLLDGTVVASSKADLLDGSIGHLIDTDELGRVGQILSVNTGSYADGTKVNGGTSPAMDQCDNWTSTAGYGVYGAYGYWADFSISQCVNLRSVYCFQQ